MDKHQQTKRIVYLMVAVDLLVVLGLVIVSRLLTSNLVLGCGLPTALAFNYVLLRRKRKIARSVPRPHEPTLRRNVFYLYAGSAIYIACPLFGLALFWVGDLPWKLLPLLLIPLSLGFYYLRAARRAGDRKTK